MPLSKTTKIGIGVTAIGAFTLYAIYKLRTKENTGGPQMTQRQKIWIKTQDTINISQDLAIGDATVRLYHNYPQASDIHVLKVSPYKETPTAPMSLWKVLFSFMP